MTTRTDITIDYNPSPRILEVDLPSTEFIAQDILDTSRKQEDTFRGISEKKLIDSSGKDLLPGGIQTGITNKFNDVQVSFQARTTPAQTGTVTTGSSPPINKRITFTDTSATFITNLVVRGSLVINFTDQSIADVFSVDSETKLTTRLLVNGIGNTFDISDVYHVFNIIQCEVLGGNLTGVDSSDLEIIPILPTAFTQIIRTGAASATIQNIDKLDTVATDVSFIRNIEGGRWKIDDSLNQMIFFKEDNITEVARYNLLDASGSPTSTAPFERTKV